MLPVIYNIFVLMVSDKQKPTHSYKTSMAVFPIILFWPLMPLVHL